MSFPGSSVVKNSPGNTGDTGLIPVAGRSPGEENWLPTPGFLPGKSRTEELGGTIVYGAAKESDRTLTTQQCTKTVSLM